MTALARFGSMVFLSMTLGACEPDARLGTDGDGAVGLDVVTTDATTPDATPAIDAGSDGGPACGCGPSSCGSRICGRSACGYPCGDCAATDFCFVGNQCQAGVGPGTACMDAFGDRVWEGDRGFRACPTDSSAVQRCTCTGGGATAWASCDATCIRACIAPPQDGITCGAVSCDPASQVCCTNASMTSTQACAAGSCTAGNYTRRCDGPEDCNGGICCGGDFPWTASCVAGATTCAPVNQFCHSGSDCPGAQPSCCPLGATDVKTCSASSGAGCN